MSLVRFGVAVALLGATACVGGVSSGDSSPRTPPATDLPDIQLWYQSAKQTPTSSPAFTWGKEFAPQIDTLVRLHEGDATVANAEVDTRDSSIVVSIHGSPQSSLALCGKIKATLPEQAERIRCYRAEMVEATGL